MATLSYTGRAVGTSPMISIPAESFNLTRYMTITSIGITIPVNPPSIANGGAFSHAMSMWLQPYPIINYNKITEPKFDGIGKHIGMITNRPDFISDFHMIGIMRNVDAVLAPNYHSHIMGIGNTPTPVAPPTT